MTASQSAPHVMRGPKSSALCAGRVNRSKFLLNNVRSTCLVRRFDGPKARTRSASLSSESLRARPSATCSCREVMLWRKESFVGSMAKGIGMPPARLRHGRSAPSSCEIVTRRSGRVIEGRTPRRMKFRRGFSGHKCDRTSTILSLPVRFARWRKP